MLKRLRGTAVVGLLGCGLSALVSGTAFAGYVQTNLVSDIPGLAALTDPNLRNPWGMSFSATSPFWVSDQATNLSTLYRVTNGVVSQVALQVAIPTTAVGPQGPTGQVNNNTSSFAVNGAPSSFIFASLNGTISAWNNSAGTTAVVQAPATGGVYTGLAIATSAGGPTLYAANGAQNRIDVFNGTFANVTGTTFAGKFVDPNIPAGLVPFNVQTIAGNVYVTYAPAGRPAQTTALPGAGAVAVFDVNGNLLRTLVSGSQLASPWGVTLAPSGFGQFGGDLLVGNFSFAASEINAFDPTTGNFMGTIPVTEGLNAPGGLWGLAFGNGVTGGSNILYFLSGINGEVDGLFAAISFVPEPAPLALLIAGLGCVGVFSRRRAAPSQEGPASLAV